MKKTIIVTGAEIGHTGYAIASRFARVGYSTVVTCIKEEEALRAAKAIAEEYKVSAFGFKLDLRNAEDASRLFSKLDDENIFAGVVCLNGGDLALGERPEEGTPFFEVTPDYVEYILQANVVGNFRIAQLAAKRMCENGGGSIVFISSNSAVRPNANRVPYIAAKGAINSMSRAMAVDLGKFGIRSNVIMPGTIKTSRWVAMGDKQISNGAMVPIGDISDFEDIANAAFYLGSEESKNVTGTELTVDGGMSVQIYPELLNRYRAEEIARRNGETQ